METKQMEAPKGLSGKKFLIGDVPSGAFVIAPKQRGRLLFFCSWYGEIQGFFPVLSDGTVSSSTKEVARVGSSSQDNEVEVFLAREIPRIKIRDGGIVWSDKRID